MNWLQLFVLIALLPVSLLWEAFCLAGIFNRLLAPELGWRLSLLAAIGFSLLFTVASSHGPWFSKEELGFGDCLKGALTKSATRGLALLLAMLFAWLCG